MRATYRALAGLIAIAVVLQAAFIAFAMFDVLSVVDEGTIYDGDFNAGQIMHSLGAIVIAVISLVLLILSFFAKIPGGVKWASIVFGVVVLQWGLAFVSFGVPFIGLLHGINAFLLAGAAGRAASLTREPATTAGPPPSRTGAPT